MADDDNVTRLHIKNRRNANNERQLTIVADYRGCQHKRALIDRKLGMLECADCGKTLNPIEFLVYLAGEEGLWFHNRQKYYDAMKRLDARSKTKCEHCGQMTRISRR